MTEKQKVANNTAALVFLKNLSSSTTVVAVLARATETKLAPHASNNVHLRGKRTA